MDNSLEQLWGEGAIRAFISHISDDKEFAHNLKRDLQRHGIAAFVAHDDIEPMSQWETEIERALFSMDLLVALLTPKFSTSNWTDQEIGVAIGRCVPVMPVRKGKDPYGLLSKYQAIPGANDAFEIATAIFKCALDDGNLSEHAVDACIAALRKSSCYAESKHLAGYMASIRTISPDQENDLIEAFNANDQVYDAFGVQDQITALLRRTTRNLYTTTRRGTFLKFTKCAPDS